MQGRLFFFALPVTTAAVGGVRRPGQQDGPAGLITASRRHVALQEDRVGHGVPPRLLPHHGQQQIGAGSRLWSVLRRLVGLSVLPVAVGRRDEDARHVLHLPLGEHEQGPVVHQVVTIAAVGRLVGGRGRGRGVDGGGTGAAARGGEAHFVRVPEVVDRWHVGEGGKDDLAGKSTFPPPPLTLRTTLVQLETQEASQPDGTLRQRLLALAPTRHTRVPHVARKKTLQLLTT